MVLCLGGERKRKRTAKARLLDKTIVHSVYVDHARPRAYSTSASAKSGPEPGPKSTSTGLPSNVAAAIACIPLIGGIIFYILEKHDSFVRFYAMQSIIFGGAWFLFNIVVLRGARCL